MNSDLFPTPIVLCVYNRPHLTRRVLQSLRTVAPSRILVVADGPKTDVPEDRLRCNEVIRSIETIDWKANIEWNVSAINLGCCRRIQTGLSWTFDRLEEAIILEDDCVPHPSFFRFCHELLDRYRFDRRIALISGSNFCPSAECSPASYFFSRYPMIWGWAAWRRSWALYDPNVDAWDRLRDTSWLSDLLADPLAAAYWRQMFDQARFEVDTWDYAMVFSCWYSGGLAVHPYRNLICNIGFSKDATHTRDVKSIFANRPLEEMHFPLVHPERVWRSVANDEQAERSAFSKSVGHQLRNVREILHRRSNPIT